MSKRWGKRAARSIALAVGLAIAAWALGQFIHLPVTPRQYISIELEAKDALLTSPPSPVYLKGDDVGGTESYMKPTGLDRWVVYLVTGEKKERIWAIDHLQFDFMQGGSEPLHILGSHLEPGFVVVVYKEHGATQVSVIQKDDPPPKGTGLWKLAGKNTLAEDADLAPGKVIAGSFRGLASEKKLQLLLQQSRPGTEPVTVEYTFFMWSGETRWRSGPPKWK
jgi:hypothetical protein